MEKNNKNSGDGEVSTGLPEAALASLGEFSSGFSYTASASRGKSGESAESLSKRYNNLQEGVSPFLFSKNGSDSTISLRGAISLCQKSYYNVPIFRNTIDLMSEFSLADVYLSGGNDQSRKFFGLWLNRINVWSIQDQFYRELYRSGNVFLYSINADISRDSMMKINELFAAELSGSASIPVRYILLNPADISVLSTTSFSSPVYYKTINQYELDSIINPKTEEDRDLLNRMPELKNLAKSGKYSSSSTSINMPLDKDRLIFCFYKKQSYEPFAVPMGYAVLEDVNSKLEMKKIDQAIARTMQQAVLLITMGDEKIGLPSPKNIQAMKALFDNNSVGKVLVSDYTTNAKFVIPDIGNLLDPKKYEIIDKDIRSGLNNILFGEDKFSNASIKVKVFFARLKYGREKFLKEFLNPEIKRIGKTLGFKSIPVAKLNDLELEDNAVMSRVYAQLASVGILTPEEVIDALQTGRMPTPEESEESQKKLTEMRKKGYYFPATSIPPKMRSDNEGKDNGANNFNVNPQKPDAGRPPGSGGEKQINVRPPRALASEENKEKSPATYSCKKMKGVLSKLTKLEKNVEGELKKRYSIKRLSKSQKEVIGQIVETICKREKLENWENEEIAFSYFNAEKIEESFSTQELEIEEVAASHGLNPYSAAILYHSKIIEDDVALEKEDGDI